MTTSVSICSTYHEKQQYGTYKGDTFHDEVLGYRPEKESSTQRNSWVEAHLLSAIALPRYSSPKLQKESSVCSAPANRSASQCGLELTKLLKIYYRCRKCVEALHHAKLPSNGFKTARRAGRTKRIRASAWFYLVGL